MKDLTPLQACRQAKKLFPNAYICTRIECWEFKRIPGNVETTKSISIVGEKNNSTIHEGSSFREILTTLKQELSDVS